MAATAGAVTLGDGTAADNALVSLAAGQSWTNNSGNNFTISDTTAAFSRVAGATLDFNNTSTGNFSMSTTVLPNTNSIVGPWAFYGTGTSMRYAYNNAGTIAAFASTGATSLGNCNSATTNYTCSDTVSRATATNVSANTFLYTGAPGAGNYETDDWTSSTTAYTVTINGILATGTNGTLNLQNSGTKASVVIGSSNELVIAGPQNVEFNLMPITGTSGALTYSGTATLTLNSDQNTYGGNTTINSGTLVVSGTACVYGATTNTATVSVASGAQIILSGAATNNALGYGSSATWTAAGTINSNGGSAQTLPATVKVNNGTLTGAANASYGTFFVNGQYAVNITASGTSNAISAANIGMSTGGTLTLNTPLATDALFVSSVLGVNNGTSPEVAGGLTKSGLGTVTLSGTNIYTGATKVNAGTLYVNPTGSIASGSTISVGNGTAGAGGVLMLGQAANSNTIVLNGGTLQSAIAQSAVDNTGTGGTITYSGGYVIHTFTSSGTLNVPGSSIVSSNILVVGGGGAGGGYSHNGTNYSFGGGGGAGGVIYYGPGSNSLGSSYSLAQGASITVTVGSGGTTTSNSTSPYIGGSGQNSILGSLTALGGGGGNSNGSNGGSGGGASNNSTGGSALQSASGSGGYGSNGASGNFAGGGGAGAAASGNQGGNGLQYSITGTSTYYAGGGNGAGNPTTIAAQGGAGAAFSSAVSGSGSANSGSGGGANWGVGAGAGGSGIVVVSYPYSKNVSGITTLSGTITAPVTSTLDAVENGGQIVVSSGISGSGGINIASSVGTGGLVQYSVAQTYAGDTSIGAGATLQATLANAMPYGTGVGNLVLNGVASGGAPTFDLNGLNQQINGLNGTASTVSAQIVNNYGSAAGDATLTLGNGDANGSFAGAIIDNTLGGFSTIALTKVGKGTQILSSANTYSGATQINAGTLALGTGGSLGNTAISVASGATFRAASGTSAGTGATLALNTLATSGAVLDLATNLTSTGSFALGSAGVTTVTLSGYNTVDSEIGLGTAPVGSTPTPADEVLSTPGSISVSGTNMIVLTRTTGVQSETYPVGTTFIIADAGTSILFGGITINSADVASYGGHNSTVTSALSVTDPMAENWYAGVRSDGAGGVELTATVGMTPEPSSLGLLGVASLSLLRRRRADRQTG